MDEAIAQAVSSWSEQPGVISHIVLCELVWVLSRAYQYSREQVAEVIHAVLTCQEFLVERVDLAELAFLDYQQGNADFSDYLLARRNQQMGSEYTVTFDREAAGAVRMMAMTDFLANTWIVGSMPKLSDGTMPLSTVANAHSCNCSTLPMSSNFIWLNIIWVVYGVKNLKLGCL